jgi:hypothetical protein
VHETEGDNTTELLLNTCEKILSGLSLGWPLEGNTSTFAHPLHRFFNGE